MHVDRRATGRRYRLTILTDPAQVAKSKSEIQWSRGRHRRHWVAISKEKMQRLHDEGRIVVPQTRRQVRSRNVIWTKRRAIHVQNLWTDMPSSQLAGRRTRRLRHSKTRSPSRAHLKASSNEGGSCLGLLCWEWNHRCCRREIESALDCL